MRLHIVFRGWGRRASSSSRSNVDGGWAGSNIIFVGQNNFSLSLSLSWWWRKCGTINFGANKGAWLDGWLDGWLADCLPAFPHFGHIINSGGKARNKREKWMPKAKNALAANTSPPGSDHWMYLAMNLFRSHPHYVHPSSESLSM